MLFKNMNRKYYDNIVKELYFFMIFSFVLSEVFQLFKSLWFNDHILKKEKHKTEVRKYILKTNFPKLIYIFIESLGL